MTKPDTSNATRALIRKSKLVAEDRLRRYFARLDHREIDQLEPRELLDRMIADGLLTPFQAEQLELGHYQGFVLGQYRIQSRIGSGGMGQIFLAEQIGTGRRVAIKVLHNSAENAPLARERFVREAFASFKLSHPNIVQIYDANPEADPPYLVMEYVDGLSLQSAVAQYGTLTPEEAAECGRQIALGLQHASDEGLVHRDIKPANVLLDRRGVVRILDLGIVRVIGECFTQLGQSDVILGTVEYLAPEQALSSQVDGRADIYSLGATLYFLLTGQTPFPDGDARAKILQLAREEPTPLTKIAPQLPAEFCAIIHKMLAKDPENRFQWASEVADALAPWAHPTDFPNRFFSQPGKTVTNEGSPTATICPDALQPIPKPVPETSTHLLRDTEESDHVQFEDQDLTTTQDMSEITLRNRKESPVSPAAEHETLSTFPSHQSTPSALEQIFWALLAIGAILAFILLYYLN